MNKYKGKGLADIVRTASSMLLFLLFTGCMLIIIAAAASTYSRITRGFDSTFNTSAAVRYISNKIRSGDSCEIIENGNGIAINDSGLICVIYCNGEGIYEKNISEGSPLTAQGGDKIFDISDIEITSDNDTYRITVSHGEETASSMIRGGGYF
ncbi:MAG: DUF4860 domain-containing protein [Oscillospiraceae bacterium]|nr:DUF4860 domain-containing protein [Oscillospiraceae bacterium]